MTCRANAETSSETTCVALTHRDKRQEGTIGIRSRVDKKVTHVSAKHDMR